MIASNVNGRTGKRELHQQRLHTGDIWSIAWSADGSRLVLGSGDKTASIVDGCTREREMHLRRLHTGSIMSVAWSVDGPRHALGSWNGPRGCQTFARAMRTLNSCTQSDADA